MAVEAKRPAVGAGCEDLGQKRVNLALIRQLLDRRSSLVAWIDGDQWLRPKAVAGIFRVDLFLDLRGTDSREGACKIRVIGDQPLIEIEDIHSSQCPILG